MKNTIKVVCVLFLIIVIAVILLIFQNKHQKNINDLGGNDSMQENEKSDQEQAEEYAEKMKPKIEKHLHKRDIHHFIKKITFENQVTINPMGHIIIRGYINDKPERFSFEALLRYESDKVDSMSYDPDLSDRFENWDDFDPQVKEDFLNSLSKKEREQYLKDIGEKEK
ncbi:DUF1433 domain-containing protein [Bacillus xiamenensis]|uniref:DUF1433 domain-containing protein n=1 Tax=Bacillus xiamenensis TaxID=1178537 RepID=UPI00028C9EAD|nr:DUF1433 domain-containing protein [Bacillus xiamenensis]EKF34371.1 hypothetical protein BA1_15494 [Bacillus xiamenensis]